jgi:uncharacterized protein (DUF433 family)
MSDAIVRDPEILSGAPIFKGTRVPLQNLFDSIEAGETLEDFLGGFPAVSREAVLQVLEECKQLRIAQTA